MPDQIDPNDQNIIVKTFNKVIQDGDAERNDFLKIILTIYTPVTSGLVFLSTTLKFNKYGQQEKLSFSLIVISSVLIVFSALIEKFAYILIADSIGEEYTAYVRKTGKHLNRPINGRPWQTFLVESQTYIRPILIGINMACILWFTLINVY
ncbi:MAG: hypothetical protein WCI36_04645 [bacterium]